MLSAHSRSAAVRQQLSGLFVALFALALGAPSAWAFRVNYSPFSQNVEGNMPYSQAVTFEISAPIDLQSDASITFNVVPTGIPSVNGIPLVDAATAKTYITVSPSPVTFTPTSRVQNVSVTFSVPRFPNVVPGTELRFSYNIFTIGWDGKVTAPVTDAGMSLNAKVTAPPPANNAPPVVTITTPADGTVFTYPVGGVPATIPMKFVANTSSPEAIVAIGATIAKQGVEPPQELTLFNKAGIGTLEASAESNMPISGPGVYTITAHGSNSKGVAETTSKFTVRVDGPPPTVAINTPAAGAVYDLVYGSTLNIPFTTTGSAPANTTIRTLEAKLYLNDGPTGVDIVLSSSGMLTTTANGTANLAIAQTGTHRVWARTTNEYGEATTSHTFTVRKAKAPLTVRAEDKTKVYGTSNPALTYTITGFVNGETLATSDVSGAPALATNATQFSPVQPPPPPGNAGAYPITSSLGTLTSANYTFIFVNGALTITPASLTVKPNIGTKAYGAPMPTLSSIGYTLTGFLGTDTISVVSGAPTLATTATATSVPGNYPLTAGLGTLRADNYTFKFEPNVFTVTKVPLVFTALNASRQYGEPNPEFSYMVTGFVNGDSDGPDAYAGGAPVLTTTATATSGVSTTPYPITFAAGLSSDKYILQFIPGGLTITARPLTLDADDKSKTQGAANPQLTYQSFGYVNGDTAATVFVTAPTLETTAVTSSPVGTYPITFTATTLALKTRNYQLTTLPGVLKVTPPAGSLVISGVVFFDVNGNATWDKGLPNRTDEPVIKGVTVELKNLATSETKRITTDQAGAYSFQVTDGKYQVDLLEPFGLVPTTPAPITNIQVNSNTGSRTDVNFGLGLNLAGIRSLKAGGYTIGYWKNNIEKVLAGQKKGLQVGEERINKYTTAIAASTFLLPPFTGITREDAVGVMGSTSSAKVALLAKQLLASEYNYQNGYYGYGGYIANNELLTRCFVLWGEYVLQNAASYSDSYLTYVQLWFDAYNNSHGGVVAGPLP